ncbi:uncharacterized protein PG986_004221 [Apiospora aurea]|uniref:Ecp2 effector protein domain-containing protein n=1 Tax=Apiospora aurea TaxID=335848 RepID=A0ABR1QMF4_9PEZI
MYARSFIAALLLTGLVAGSPMPGKNQPITDDEWAALKSGGLKARSPKSVNQPITDDEWSALKSGGLKARDDGGLEARDHKMNCGHKVNGKGGSNGHGKWIPVAQFSKVADEFCSGYVGTDIAKGHETSDTYPITLTNQKNDKQTGPAGNIVFAIYNTERDGTYVVDHDTCMKAMKAPLGSHAVKRGGDGQEHVYLGKRDDCYGKKHNDYEGGYWKVDGIGAFGSEVYAA